MRESAEHILFPLLPFLYAAACAGQTPPAQTPTPLISPAADSDSSLLPDDPNDTACAGALKEMRRYFSPYTNVCEIPSSDFAQYSIAVTPQCGQYALDIMQAFSRDRQQCGDHEVCDDNIHAVKIRVDIVEKSCTKADIESLEGVRRDMQKVCQSILDEDVRTQVYYFEASALLATIFCEKHEFMPRIHALENK